MKILILSELYQDAVVDFKKKLDGNVDISYDEKKSILEDLGYAYDKSGICDALNESGYCADYIIINVEDLQKTWVKENLPQNTYISFEGIIIKQIKVFNPDVLWYDLDNENLLKSIREKCPWIKLFIGWSGSAIAKSNHWKYIDVVLSCAQESVDFFIKNGLAAAQIHHAFNPKILKNLNSNLKNKELVFIGQLVRNSEFHLKREYLLIQLLDVINIDIYSPSANIGYVDIGKYLLKKSIYEMTRLLKFDNRQNESHLLNRVLGWNGLIAPVNIKLKKYLKKPVFGQKMFDILHSSGVVLNIHADSSPKYASNMRIFETTGVGSCLVTDWRENVNELFSTDEIITYVSIEDCIDKIKWLEKHPEECGRIALAGQKRCLKDHLYKNRVDKLIKTIYKYI
ncbi:glycosyltransferase [Pectinatus frisingensis]|uniref:glycosyltransferase family protein n=1 Tax=Pectinatus frisingensis TaxID=865 RepID=UPI0018C6292D|nr:glycosyltransferase [Pectinatus frisingensis]